MFNFKGGLQNYSLSPNCASALFMLLNRSAEESAAAMNRRHLQQQNRESPISVETHGGCTYYNYGGAAMPSTSSSLQHGAHNSPPLSPTSSGYDSTTTSCDDSASSASPASFFSTSPTPSPPISYHRNGLSRQAHHQSLPHHRDPFVLHHVFHPHHNFSSRHLSHQQPQPHRGVPPHQMEPMDVGGTTYFSPPVTVHFQQEIVKQGTTYFHTVPAPTTPHSSDADSVMTTSFDSSSYMELELSQHSSGGGSGDYDVDFSYTINETSLVYSPSQRKNQTGTTTPDELDPPSTPAEWKRLASEESDEPYRVCLHRHYDALFDALDSVSHQQVLAGRHAGDISIGIRRNSKVAETTEQDFYAYLLSKHLADTEALRLNSYPLWTDFDKDEVAIASVQRDVGKGKKHWTPDHDLVRDCSRCGTEFFINPRGPPTKVDCCYHPQRTVYVRAKFEQRFQCCNQESTARGCSMASYHVSDTLRNSELKTFVEAPDASGPDDPRSKKVYALDCEMVYTVHGPAVARLSVVDVTNEMVLDVLIKPEHQVTDFNTRFSGITANMLEEGDIYSRAEAQQMLFDFVNKETILVGHSLESDLKAMRIVHMNVVDTALVYPHKNGPPAKRALRNIAYDELGMIIQADEGGHDSKEDAAACMKLLRHKAGYDKVHLARM